MKHKLGHKRDDEAEINWSLKIVRGSLVLYANTQPIMAINSYGTVENYHGDTLAQVEFIELTNLVMFKPYQCRESWQIIAGRCKCLTKS